MDDIGELLGAGIRDALTQGAFLPIIRDKEAVGNKVIAIIKEQDSVQDWKIRYGLEVFSIKVLDINMENPELYRKLMAQWEADKEGEATKTEALAKAEAFTTMAKAVTAQGSVGRLLVIADAMKESELGAAITVQAIPGLGIPGLAGGGFEPEGSEELRARVSQLNVQVRELVGSLTGEE